MNNELLLNNIINKISFKIGPSQNVRKQYIYRFKKKIHKFFNKEKKFINSNTRFENIDNLDHYIDNMEQPDIVATSNYMWNSNKHLYILKKISDKNINEHVSKKDLLFFISNINKNGYTK